MFDACRNARLTWAQLTVMLVMAGSLAACSERPNRAGETTASDASSAKITWEDDVRYEGRRHIKVVTPAATYYYDKAGGGFSRIIDPDGTDWVNWHPTPTEYPPSGAGMSRGLPNYTDGPGHPGYDACTSAVTDSSSAALTIRSACRDSSWVFAWTFYPDYARNHVRKIPEDIWVLYEGPINGRFAPDRQYWGTNTGGLTDAAPNYVGGEQINGAWEWAYFGDESTDRVLYLAMEEPYTDVSMFGYLGAAGSSDEPLKAMNAEEGMIVFGFGRRRYPDKFISGGDKTFYLGFVERAVEDSSDHAAVARRIEAVRSEQSP